MPKSLVAITNNKWEQSTQIFHLDCAIYLDDEENSTSQSDLTISGRVVLTVSKPTAFYGISLALAGRAATKLVIPNAGAKHVVQLVSPTWCDPQLFGTYQTAEIISHLGNVEGGVRIVEQEGPVYMCPGVITTLTRRGIQSSVMIFEHSAMNRSIISNALRTQLDVGIHTFPFIINLDILSNIPSSLNHKLGCIQHILGLYMNPNPIGSKFTPKSATMDYLILSKFYEKEINLRQRINCKLSEFNALQVTSKREGRVTGDDKTCIQGDLLLEQSKLVLGEIIRFKLTITNQNGGRISDASVSLVQKLKSTTFRFSKSQFTIISSTKYRGIVGTKTNLEWEGSLDISQDLRCSFSTEPDCIDIIYFVRFTISVIGKGEVTGEIPIAIGTTRADVTSDEMSSRNKGNIKFLDHQYFGPDYTTGDTLEVLPMPPSFPLTSTSRRHTLSGGRVSLPPAYSELSLVGLCKAPSFETLPPPYDEVSDLDLSTNLNLEP